MASTIQPTCSGGWFDHRHRLRFQHKVTPQQRSLHHDRRHHPIKVWFVVAVIAVWPIGSLADLTVENDPSALALLPPGYPVERVPVDATQYPWRTIGRVSLLGGRHYCTGTLIGPAKVLTAAHCVWPLRNHPHEVHFLAGFERSDYLAHARAAGFVFAPTYHHANQPAQALTADWAIIELDTPIGTDVGYLPWRRFGTSTDRAQANFPQHVIAGYRSDRPYVLTVDHRCQLIGFIADGQLFAYNCPIRGGDSGGPVLLQQDSDYYLVGITTAGIIDPNSISPRLHNRPNMSIGYAVPTKNMLLPATP